ncbi:hypothetical protein MKEN_00540300 [Mycena kentingensis (nom. inval.)]|nr:hypothetical protein MKEN_00540300 [Mycena kentingensis (nom. inval.)]
MQRRLPAELEDTVIDFSHTDVKTLATCGLVCRSWRPASRYHLFSSVFLTGQNAVRFAELLKTPATTTNSNIAHHVRDVQLRFSDATLPLLLPLLAALPRTTRIAFRPARDEIARTLTPALLHPLVPRLPIEHLVFDFKSRFDSLKQVIDCVSLCPRLVSLELGGSWLRMGDFTYGPGMRVNAQLPPNLRALTLTCDLDYILNWLLQLEGHGPAIEQLQLHHIVRREVPAIVAYLEHAGPGLESLALLFRDNDAPDRLANKIDLSHAPNLLKLALEGTGPSILACLLKLSRQSCSSTRKLERISLTLRHASYYPDAMRLMEEFPWAQLDEAVMALPGLRRLDVVAADPLTRHPLPQVKAFMLQRLPRACGAGIAC